MQVTTGGRDRRNFVGGIWLDSLSSVEHGVVSGLEFTLRPTETPGLSAEEKLAFSWVFDGYQEDMEMEESAGA